MYAQSLFEEQGYACASIKHVVTRHARMAAANPMLGISEAVGALYRRGCSSAAPAVTKEWLAGWQPTRWSAASQARNDGVVSVRARVSRASRASEPLDMHGTKLRGSYLTSQRSRGSMRGAVRRRRSSLRVPVLRLSILMHLTHTRCACEASVSIVGSSHGFPSRSAHAAAARGACMPLMGRTCETLQDCTDDCTNMTRRLPRSRCRRLHAGGRRTE